MHRAALELVAEHGLDGVTVEMIAERAGVSPRTFFNHWATKETAILGLVIDSPEEFHRRLLTESPESTPEQALRQVLREIIQVAQTDLDVRELKKEVLRREPQLHAVNAGRTHHIQAALVTAFEYRVRQGAVAPDRIPSADDEAAGAFPEGLGDGGPEHARAVIAVQMGFALTRSAFSLSMAGGTEVVDEFDRILRMVDAGDVRI
ncbi:TetR family transcriptional regulator [Brachybacterium endophyticum]|uniref:TetR family transcriptional regulator n=2 Tax=Brachybacterium endophyticum TaxID=2182385 RepID=A0A2U2RPX8_9MICO|nr:TetR family transcriptional regulator [Brachybacterium endophyticum]